MSTIGLSNPPVSMPSAKPQFAFMAYQFQHLLAKKSMISSRHT